MRAAWPYIGYYWEAAGLSWFSWNMVCCSLKAENLCRSEELQPWFPVVLLVETVAVLPVSRSINTDGSCLLNWSQRKHSCSASITAHWLKAPTSVRLIWATRNTQVFMRLSFCMCVCVWMSFCTFPCCVWPILSALGVQTDSSVKGAPSADTSHPRPRLNSAGFAFSLWMIGQTENCKLVTLQILIRAFRALRLHLQNSWEAEEILDGRGWRGPPPTMNDTLETDCCSALSSGEICRTFESGESENTTLQSLHQGRRNFSLTKKRNP